MFYPLPRLKRLGLLAAAAALATAAVWPIFHHPSYWGVEDWDVELAMQEVPRLTVAAYHQIPLWNPYHCGGLPMLANPQSRILTPFFVLHLLFGTIYAIKLEIVSHVFLAIVGAYLFACKLGLDPIEAALSCAVFGLSSIFSVNLSCGGTWLFPAAYLPWAFLFAVPGAPGLVDIVGGAIALALMFSENGGYALIITLSALGLYAVSGAVLERSRRRLLGFILTGLLMFAVGAVKFFPSVEFMKEYPHPMKGYSGFSLHGLLDALTDRDQRLSAPRLHATGLLSGISYDWDENGTYIGWIPLALGLIGLAFGARGYRPLRITLAALVYLMLGNRIRPSMWNFFHESLPIYKGMLVSQRFRMAALLLFSIFSGAGLAIVRAAFVRLTGRRRWGDVAGAGLVALVLIDLIMVGHPVWKEGFVLTPPSVTRHQAFEQIGEFPRYGADSAELPALRANEGTVGCYTSVSVPIAAVPRGAPGYRGEVFLEGAAGSASYVDWTPNRLKIAVRTEAPGYVVVNQNYSPHWRSADGRPVTNRRGLIAMAVTPSDGALELDYRSISFSIGAFVSLLSLGALGAWLLAASNRDA